MVLRVRGCEEPFAWWPARYAKPGSGWNGCGGRFELHGHCLPGGGALFGKAEAFFGGISLFGVRLGFRGNGASLSRVIFGLAGFLIAGIAWLLGSVSLAGLRAQRRKEREG